MAKLELRITPKGKKNLHEVIQDGIVLDKRLSHRVYECASVYRINRVRTLQFFQQRISERATGADWYNNRIAEVTNDPAFERITVVYHRTKKLMPEPWPSGNYPADVIGLARPSN